MSKLNEAKIKYPDEITASGYSIRLGEPNGYHNSDQLVARDLKNGSIKWGSKYNYQRPAGTPWVRALTRDDAKAIIDYLKINQPDILSYGNHTADGTATIVNNGNEQVLKKIGTIISKSGREVPVYVTTGNHYKTKYGVDKKLGDKIVPVEDLPDNSFPNLRGNLKRSSLVSLEALKKYIIQKACVYSNGVYGNAYERLRSYIYLFRDNLDKDIECPAMYLQYNVNSLLSVYIKELVQGISFDLSKIMFDDLLKNLDIKKTNYLIMMTKEDKLMSDLENVLLKDGFTPTSDGYLSIDPELNCLSLRKGYQKINNSIIITENELFKNTQPITSDIRPQEVNKLIWEVSNNIADFIDNNSGLFDAMIKELLKDTLDMKDVIIEIANPPTEYFESKEYNWIYDTILVYVQDTYRGGGYRQEIPVVNNSITDSIKAYKKTLGRGYWIEYLGPGKKHKNDKPINEAANRAIVTKLNTANKYYSFINKYGLNGFARERGEITNSMLKENYPLIGIETPQAGYLISLYDDVNDGKYRLDNFESSKLSGSYYPNVLLIASDEDLYRKLKELNIILEDYEESYEESLKAFFNIPNNERKLLLQAISKLNLAGKEEDGWNYEEGQVLNNLLLQAANDPEQLYRDCLDLLQRYNPDDEVYEYYKEATDILEDLVGKEYFENYKK